MNKEFETTIAVDASINKLDGRLLKGYRIGVVDLSTGEIFTFTNGKAETIQEAEAYAVLKGCQVAERLGYEYVLIHCDNKQIVDETFKLKKVNKFMYLARKAVKFKMKWVPRSENQAADEASRMKIKKTPRAEWI